MENASLSAIFEGVTTGVTAAISWIGSYADAVVEHPVLLLGVIVSLMGFGIGALKRLTNV